MSTLISYNTELLTFDAKTTEDYSEEANVTEHPVEQGGFVTDHRQDRPMTIDIEGIISESPFKGQANPASVVEGAVAGRRGLEAVLYFRRNRKDIFYYVSTRLGTSPNLALQSMKVSVQGTMSTKFNLTFKQVKFARAQIVDIPPEFVPKASAEPTLKCGEQATTDITAPLNSDAQAASLARNLDDFTRSTGSNILAQPVDDFNQLFDQFLK